MSTLFLEDVISSIIQITEADKTRLTRHVYSLHAYYASAEMIVVKILERYPDFEYRYEPVPMVDKLLSHWPDVIVDQHAKNDWGWSPMYDFDQSVERIFQHFEVK